jgi:hypothetical protein
VRWGSSPRPAIDVIFDQELIEPNPPAGVVPTSL